MTSLRYARVLGLLLPFIAACSEEDPPEVLVIGDTGSPDTAVVIDSDVPVDSGVADSSVPEDSGSPMDSTITDSGVVDSSVDSGPVDTGVKIDSTPETAIDSAPIDTGPLDTGVLDTGVLDTGVTDTGVLDTGVLDTGVLDTGVADTGVLDTALAPTCTDGVKNGTETDLDCGGACAPCGFAKTCAGDNDCAAGLCGTFKTCRHPRTCKELHNTHPSLPSGRYTVQQSDALGSFNVYCDMTTDGGGWTKVLHTANGFFTSTSAATGDPTTAANSGQAKLSDAQINSLRGVTTTTIRFMGNVSTDKVYLQTASPWVDSALAMGLMSGGGKPACLSSSLAGCSFTPEGGTIDTTAWGIDANDCRRHFTDYDGPVTCWSAPSPGVRCWRAGNTCFAPGDHPFIGDFSVWIRE